eukprot:3759242-Amphidinium_carterae.2
MQAFAVSGVCVDRSVPNKMLHDCPPYQHIAWLFEPFVHVMPFSHKKDLFIVRISCTCQHTHRTSFFNKLKAWKELT